jgi:II/X family phage/plasmid replication protein
MAIDTVKLRSPYVTEAVATVIENRLVTRTAIDRATGELLYELSAGSLEGSWDSRISVKVCREEWQSTRLLASAENKKAAVHTKLVASEPYIEVEGSVHKALMGHNVYGGPCDFLSSCRWFIAHLALGLGCELPDADSWLVRRADWAEIYELPYEAIEQYVHGLNNATYPRREGAIARYGDQSLSCPGTTSTVKLYHKGPEFSKHDYRRLRPLMNTQQQQEGYLVNLQKRANELLRVETTVKARKLDDDFKHPPTVREMTEAYLVTVHDREVARLLREGGTTMKTVRKHHEVRDRLYETYEPRLAGLLFGTWLQLAALGEKVTREKLPASTFRRYRKQLQDAGVAWHGGDVHIVEVATILPADFSPVRSDPRRVTGEDPRVVELLAPYRDRKEVA